MWTIVFLAMGGIALGKGVESSGLLGVMDTHIRDLVEGLGIYTVVMVLTPIVLVGLLYVPICLPLTPLNRWSLHSSAIR